MSMQANKTSATTVTFSQPQEIVISHLDDSIKLGDGTQVFTGGQKAASASLPVNLSTEDKAKLDSVNTSLDSLETKADTSNSSLASIDGKITANMVASTNNSSSALVVNGNTWAGTWEDVSGFNTVTVAAKTDQSGSLYVEFSPDGTNGDSSISFETSANINEVHRLTITRRYFRIRFLNNSGASQTFFRVQSLLGNHPLLTSALNSTLQPDADAIATRAVLFGKNDDGNYREVKASGKGHLEVAIHDPLLPFGSLHTEKLTPVFQFDAVYGLNDALVRTTTQLSGTVTDGDGMFTVSSGTTAGARSALQSRKRLRYRAGQGSVLSYTALFNSPVALSYQFAGLGHPEDGHYWGYNGTVFGVHKATDAIREVQTLTITTGSSTAESITVTLSGAAFSIPVTNSANANRTAWEIARFASYVGWQASQKGNTVIFLADVVGDKTGAFSIAGTTVVGSFSETRAGVAATVTTIAQASFNGDRLDGTGRSGFTIDPSRLNIYRISMQYLGTGTVEFSVMVTPDDANNTTWVVAHTIKNPNTLLSPHVKNPSMPFTVSAISLGSTTNLQVKTASANGSVEGAKVLHGPRLSYINSLTTVGTVNIQALITLKNELTYRGKSSQVVANIVSVAGAIKHTNPVIYYMIKNGTLGGNPNFADYSTQSAMTVDTTATTVTYTDNAQLLWTGHLGDTSSLIYDFANGLEEFTIQPGEYVTLGARSVSGSPAFVTASINIREDQ